MTAFSPTPTLESHRQQFPALANKAYFNYGGQGPMSQRSLTAISETHQLIQQMGPFSNETNRWITQKTEETRQAIAAELGADPIYMTLTENVTVGCNIALWGMDWQSGDHLLISDCEHPGVIGTILELQRRFGIEVTTCPLQATLNQGDPIDVIQHHLRPNTRLLVISHILWNTGQVLPLAAIVQLCHTYPAQRGPVRVLVDAAQSVGSLPLNLTELAVDFYAFTGHKWLCGPAGVGGLYVHPDAIADLHPTFIGWRSLTKNATGYPTGFQPNGQRYEVATSDYPLYSGLQEAIATHQAWGTPPERYQRILTLSTYLWQQLAEIPGLTCLRTTPPESGLISFQVQPGGNTLHTHIVNTLEQQGFLLRTILDPDCIRACVHYFTLETEIDRLVEAIREGVKE